MEAFFNDNDIENYEIDGWCSICEEPSRFTVVEECYCHVVDGAGYTYNDEYGDCEYCDNKPAICGKCGAGFTLEEIKDHRGKQ